MGAAGEMTQPEALRLADELERDKWHVPAVVMQAAADELRRLHAENFALAAGQCMNVVGDEGGSPICAKAQQLQAARERDNVSFKELLAQRDALLSALKGMLLHMGMDEDEWNKPTFDHARAAIKAVEEGENHAKNL